ncbi:MAG: C25 family cysteine peptidase, partial [Nitrospirota bacterium]|nr:C25 family cysteine peptidase [Nitrospirota bacterium]
MSSWTSRPSHLFLVGKSIHEMNISATVGARNNPDYYAKNLVPSWGYPGSDLVFTAGLAGTNLEAAIPTGRLAAQNTDHVLLYLNKVVELENQPPALWQKNVLHFGGGSAAWEQSIFVNYLNVYKSIISDTSFGGKVYTFLKNTTDAWQINLADSVQLLINEGVSLMTFFGHASSTGFDQNIDSPLNYNNQGKYPLLVGNSCYTGNIHLGDGQSTSESFVLVPDRGVIGFIAKPDLGQPFYLSLWSENFFRELFQKNYGKSIGQCMVEAVKDIQMNTDPLRINIVLTMTLHGDPSVHLYPWPKPDYSVAAERVFFDPIEVTAQAETFDVKVVVDNIGKAVHQPVSVELVRHFPSGMDSSYTQVLDEVLNRDTVTFTIPVDRFNGVGQNTFDVFVDFPANTIEELNDFSNNIVQGKPLLITSGDLIPIYPYEFAIVPGKMVTLKASTGYAFESEKTYHMELDTTDTFDSPSLLSTSIIQSGGVVEWNPGISLVPGRVYFWRCSPDSINPDNPFVWRESSFEHIPGKTGWGQSHFFQFKNDPLTRLEYDRPERNWDFSTTGVTLKCDVYGNPSTSQEVLGTRYQLDLDVQDYSGCGSSPALMVAVIDSVSLQPWESNYNNTHPENDFGNLMDCSISRARPEKYFIFRQNNQEELEGFADMVENHVPDGDYLLIYTWKYANYTGWSEASPAVFDVFEGLGAEQIGVAADSVPFIYFVKKGHPETKVELYGDAIDADLFLDVELIGVEGLGFISSPKVGPSSDWQSATWDMQSSEEAAGDTTFFTLYGSNYQGVEFNLGQWPEVPGEVMNLGDFALPEYLPFLRLEAKEQDFINQTPPQLSAWRILHQPVPECALNPNASWYVSADTL